MPHPFMSELLKALRKRIRFTDDPRGHSCLVLGFTSTRRPIHVVCTPKDEFLVVITAYEPSLNKWMPDFKARMKT